MGGCPLVSLPPMASSLAQRVAGLPAVLGWEGGAVLLPLVPVSLVSLAQLKAPCLTSFGFLPPGVSFPLNILRAGAQLRGIA